MHSPIARWKLLATCLALSLGTGLAQSQTIYRIVGADGKVTFSDKPPAESANATARTAAGKPVATSASDPAGLPYELRQVVTRFPVTLYSGPGCVPCNSGRLLLQGRGIPFTEFTINTPEDVDALQRLSGDRSLPFLTIGGQKIKGFSEAEWTQFLNAAQYPASSQLSGNYRNPQAKPLVTVQKAAIPVEQAENRNAGEEQAASSASAPAPVVAPANPAGIKF